MAKTGFAQLFRYGRSQAVRLPKEFRFEVERVRDRRVEQGVLLEPLVPTASEWFALDRFRAERFMPKGRQPVVRRREIFE